MINSLFRRPLKFSVSFVSSSLFPGVPSSNYHGGPSESLQGLTLCFQFLFLFIPFVYRSSSWRFYMMVHQGFNSFSKCSSRFSAKRLKLSSYCNPECNSFFRIIGDGIMSLLIIWIHVSWFTCCHEWDISNPSISSLELSWVIFHLKPSLRMVVIIVLINDPSSSFILSGAIYFLISLFLST